MVGGKECVGLSWIEVLGRHEWNGIEVPVDLNLLREIKSVRVNFNSVVNQSGQIVLIAGHVEV
jgi:hypothetical protein